MFSSALNPQQHERAIEALKNEKFDLLVIGGGVNGAGIALDAASRGLTVALIEAHDLASGTSSRSSKLIHGGLRYLEQYDFKLVREALHERELMVKTLAPHLVKPVSFLYPLHEKVKDRTYIGAGLALYDALRGFKRALPNHKHMSQKTISEVAPSLRLDIVTGGIKYFDAQVDDARHTMMIARTAARHGAQIATRTSALSLLREGKRVIGAKVRLEESGDIIDVHAGVTVMAAGVWTDPLYDAMELKPGYRVRMSKGVHIVLPKEAIKAETGIILKTSVSVLFIIPWNNQWMVGTTDTDYTGDRNEPLSTAEDVQYIIDQANRVLDPKIRREDVIGVFAGLRPLVSTAPDAPTTKLSREHVVDHPAQGFVSIAGGKYTTYRVMSEDAVNAAVPDLRRLVPDSCTETLPLVGADGYSVLLNQLPLLSSKFNLSQDMLTHLINRYGSLMEDLLEMIRADRTLAEPISPESDVLKVEILYAVTHEGARSVSDVLTRRTRLSFELKDRGLSIARRVAELIAPTLRWSEENINASISEYEKIVDREIAELEANLKVAINS
ncbi:MAG: glycerol-3-phosphate dehydrogenase [Actinobacteria bacterium]|nr:glycerol-3-phosphate dehydrogenase [Actinomycetota bacterium]